MGTRSLIYTDDLVAYLFVINIVLLFHMDDLLSHPCHLANLIRTTCSLIRMTEVLLLCHTGD